MHLCDEVQGPDRVMGGKLPPQARDHLAVVEIAQHCHVPQGRDLPLGAGRCPASLPFPTANLSFMLPG